MSYVMRNLIPSELTVIHPQNLETFSLVRLNSPPQRLHKSAEGKIYIYPDLPGPNRYERRAAKRMAGSKGAKS